MEMEICNIIKKYKELKNDLVCPGEEVSANQVGWNDMIYSGMEELIKDVPEHIKKQIKLNHI